MTVVSKCHVYLKSIKQKKILKRYANNANGTVIEENTIVGMQYDFIYLVVTIKYM